MKNSLKHQAWRWLPGIFISIVALIVLLNVVQWEDLMRAFSTLNPLVIAAGVVLTILSSMARAQTWRTLLDPKPKFMQSFHILNIGFFMNNVLPLRTGEIGRAILMGKIVGLGTFQVISSVVIERSFDLAIAAGLLLSTLPLALGLDWARPLATVVLALVILGLFGLYLMARYSLQVKFFIQKIGEKNRIINRVFVPPLLSLVEGLKALTSLKKMLLSLFWILLAWFIFLIATYVFLTQFTANPPFWWVLFLNGAVALGVAVPAAPGSIGVYEASVVGALSILKIDTSQALAFGIALHLMNLATMSILGLIGLAQMGYSFADLSSKIQANQPTKPE